MEAAEILRYSFLVGNAGRTDAEEQEMRDLRTHLADYGLDPGWDPVPRMITAEQGSECSSVASHAGGPNDLPRGAARGSGGPVTPVEAAEILRERLASYAHPDSFSFAFGTKAADLQCEVEHGRTVGVRLTPARVTLVMSFDGRSGVRASMEIEEATLDAIVETAVRTVETLLKPLEAP